MATFQIAESVEIDRPADTVFRYVTDLSRQPLWRPNVSIRDLSGEPLRVGTTWSEVSKFMGREMVVDFEVTALEQGRRLEMKQEGAGVSGKLTWSFSPIMDDSSEFTLSFDGELSGWLAGLASGLLRNQAQKDMKRDLANLKSNMEAG